MNGALYMQKRGRRHMARWLEQFERLIEPHLPPGTEEDARRFKAISRDVVKELTGDACDVIEALESGVEINGLAVELRDRVGAHA